MLLTRNVLPRRCLTSRPIPVRPVLRSVGALRPWRLSLPSQLCRRAPVSTPAHHDKATSQPQAVAVDPEEGQSSSGLFVEPLVRGLVLGAASGIILECLHVATKFAGIANEAGAQLPSVLPQMQEQFAPLFVWDHVTAISLWAVFYAIEAASIMTVLRAYPDDMRKAASTVRSTMSLPKRMLPVSLTRIRRLLRSFSNVFRFRSSPALQQSASAAPDTLANTSNAFLPDSGPTQGLPGPGSLAPGASWPGAVGGGGVGVLERPNRQMPGSVRPKRMLLPPVPGAPGTVVDAPAVPPPKQRKGLLPGAWAPEAWNPTRDGAPVVGTRARQLADRAAFLKNFWYAAALSSKLKEGKVMQVEMLGRTVALFRDSEGVAHCLDDICPHRGAPLSSGWVTKVKGHDCVVCPYHGWAFDTEGKVREVPSSGPDAPLPKRSLIDAYPVQEQGGFVYLFFGDKALPAEERPPIPWVPELALPGWKAVYGEIEFDAPHWSVFDNAIDMAHIHYLHGDSFGNDDRPVIHDMEVSRDTFSIEGTFRIHNKPVSPLWNFTAVDSVPVVAKAMLPSTSAITIQLGNGIKMITFVNTVPISATRAVNRFALIRNFAGWEGFDAWARQAMFRILGEDKVMVETLKPDRMRQEVSLEADLPQIAFRKLRQEWIDMGYGVAPEGLGLFEGSLRLGDLDL